MPRHHHHANRSFPVRWMLLLAVVAVVTMGGGSVARVQVMLLNEATPATSPPMSSVVPPSSSLPRLTSTVRCTGDNTTLPGSVFGVSVVNRSCLYENLILRDGKWWFVGEGLGGLPEVSLASKPILIGKKSFKKQYPTAYAQIQWGYKWRPGVTDNTTHTHVLDGLSAMYSPEVAPWNYAHTLFNDLFPLYWGMEELGVEGVTDTRVIVYGALYDQPFQPDRKKWLPQNNAFPSFTTTPPMWDHTLARQCGGEGCLVKKLLVGSGSRTWAYVTKDYTSPGGVGLWWRFRRHILKVLGVERTRPRGPGGGDKKMVICDKKSDNLDNKRGILNTANVTNWLQNDIQGLIVDRVALSNLPVKQQTQLMVDTDIYMCNEGTMGTAFFLMEPGSVWVSVMNIFRRNSTYDLYRPYSQKHFFWNTGGNIDWFPPAIRWIKALHYDKYLAGEVRMDVGKGNFRNYLPNWSVALNRSRVVSLLREGVKFIDSGKTETDGDNHSVMGRMCAQMMTKLGTSREQIQHMFTSVKCTYGMSWLCEYLVNGDQIERAHHPKWKKGCGSTHRPTPSTLSIPDPREAWLTEFKIEEPPRHFDCPTPPLTPHPCPSTPGHPCCKKQN